MARTDVVVDWHQLVIVRPTTAKARAWMRQRGLEDECLSWRGGIVVDRSGLDALLIRLRAAGLRVVDDGGRP